MFDAGPKHSQPGPSLQFFLDMRHFVSFYLLTRNVQTDDILLTLGHGRETNLRYASRTGDCRSSSVPRREFLAPRSARTIPKEDMVMQRRKIAFTICFGLSVMLFTKA